MTFETLVSSDSSSMNDICDMISGEAAEFLRELPHRPVGVPPRHYDAASLPEDGIGAEKSLAVFKGKYFSGITGSTGPRYFGFVTGGATPAAVAGDWLATVYDQNATGESAVAKHIEAETIGFLRELFGLSDSHFGSFVSGATMANFVGLALARQWAGRQARVDVAQDGVTALPQQLPVFSGEPHSCIFKALSMLGLGRNSVQLVPCLPDREAIDIDKLQERLMLHKGQPSIVVANAGTVNSVDFDYLAGLAELKEEFNFWLHVDAAFGGFAACSPLYSHLVAGLDAADSIAIDAHKWLNVPYDSAMQFTRHKDLQLEVFVNRAAYLGEPSDNPDYVHLTPENSRRFRALPAWFSLMSYGRAGYQEMVERSVRLAQLLGRKIDESEEFKLLAPVRMNVVCFTFRDNEREVSAEAISEFVARVQAGGKVYLTPTVYKGAHGMRAALVNWRTSEADIKIAWQALRDTFIQPRKEVVKSV